jgi:hypothetical protein
MPAPGDSDVSHRVGFPPSTPNLSWSPTAQQAGRGSARTQPEYPTVRHAGLARAPQLEPASRPTLRRACVGERTRLKAIGTDGSSTHGVVVMPMFVQW